VENISRTLSPVSVNPATNVIKGSLGIQREMAQKVKKDALVWIALQANSHLTGMLCATIVRQEGFITRQGSHIATYAQQENMQNQGHQSALNVNMKNSSPLQTRDRVCIARWENFSTFVEEPSVETNLLIDCK